MTLLQIRIELLLGEFETLHEDAPYALAETCFILRYHQNIQQQMTNEGLKDMIH